MPSGCLPIIVGIMGLKRFYALAFLLAAGALAAFPVYFKEQYYRLYHIHYVQYPDDSIENIYYLEQAMRSDFCNPLYAMAKIDDKKEWSRYRNLLDMHIRLKLIEQHLVLGSKWDKRVAYFYNAPWKKENLESLDTAETCYRTALAYWPEAKRLALEAMKARFVTLEEVQYFEDEAFRIEKGLLDYERIINEELARVRKVRAAFEAMNETTY
jgi:hypothetical protein